MKNLVFLAKALQILDGENESTLENGQDKQVALEEGNNTEDGIPFTLTALLSRMNKLAKLEASQTPKHTQKVSRTSAVSLSLLVLSI